MSALTRKQRNVSVWSTHKLWYYFFEPKPFGGSLTKLGTHALGHGETHCDDGVDVLHRTRQLNPNRIIASILEGLRSGTT